MADLTDADLERLRGDNAAMREARLALGVDASLCDWLDRLLAEVARLRLALATGKAWCGCGDSIEPGSGGVCATCLVAGYVEVAEVTRLRLTVAGHEKADALLRAGMAETVAHVVKVQGLLGEAVGVLRRDSLSRCPACHGEGHVNTAACTGDCPECRTARELLARLEAKGETCTPT